MRKKLMMRKVWEGRNEKEASGGKGQGKEKWSTGHWGSREREKEAEKQRAVVDNTAIIHLSDSLPNAPLGETQRCVTSNAQHTHTNSYTRLHTCAYTYRGNTCLWLHALGQWYVAGHSRSVHTPLHCNLYKHKSQPQASVTHSHVYACSHSHANI